MHSHCSTLFSMARGCDSTHAQDHLGEEIAFFRYLIHRHLMVPAYSETDHCLTKTANTLQWSALRLRLVGTKASYAQVPDAHATSHLSPSSTSNPIPRGRRHSRHREQADNAFKTKAWARSRSRQTSTRRSLCEPVRSASDDSHALSRRYTLIDLKTGFHSKNSEIASHALRAILRDFGHLSAYELDLEIQNALQAILRPRFSASIQE